MRARVQERVPYGPTRAYLSSKEARLLAQELDPAVKADFIKRVGEDEWARMMKELYD